MTSTPPSTPESSQQFWSEVSATKENVRHNEKAIDRVDIEFKEFRTEIRAELKELRAEIKDDFSQLSQALKDLNDKLDAVSTKADNIVWKLAIPAIAGIAGGVAVRVLTQIWP